MCGVIRNRLAFRGRRAASGLSSLSNGQRTSFAPMITLVENSSARRSFLRFANRVCESARECLANYIFERKTIHRLQNVVTLFAGSDSLQLVKGGSSQHYYPRRGLHEFFDFSVDHRFYRAPVPEVLRPLIELFVRWQQLPRNCFS